MVCKKWVKLEEELSGNKRRFKLSNAHKQSALVMLSIRNGSFVNLNQVIEVLISYLIVLLPKFAAPTYSGPGSDHSERGPM